MQLLELTAAEMAFFSAEAVTRNDFQQRLGKRLTTTLSARLRMTVQLQPCRVFDAAVEAGMTPAWQPDDALANLWLTRRLGGQRIAGKVSFMPRTLIDTLDEILAECWFGEKKQDKPMTLLAWNISTNLSQARLELRLPHLMTDMTHWAQGVIQRV